MNQDSPVDQGRFAYDGLDRVIHERARLSILTSLATHPHGLSFNSLKQLCSLTDGNLSRHLQVLADSGLLEISKGSQNSRSLTSCQLTAEGRNRFMAYLSVLESVLTDAQQTATESATTVAFGEGLAPA